MYTVYRIAGNIGGELYLANGGFFVTPPILCQPRRLPEKVWRSYHNRQIYIRQLPFAICQYIRLYGINTEQSSDNRTLLCILVSGTSKGKCTLATFSPRYPSSIPMSVRCFFHYICTCLYCLGVVYWDPVFLSFTTSVLYTMSEYPGYVLPLKSEPTPFARKNQASASITVYIYSVCAAVC